MFRPHEVELQLTPTLNIRVFRACCETLTHFLKCNLRSGYWGLKRFLVKSWLHQKFMCTAYICPRGVDCRIHTAGPNMN